MTKIDAIDPKRFAPLEGDDAKYIYNPALLRAIRVALATNRPLLLRGAPGTGKTTLARDVAASLLDKAGARGADYYEEVITSRTEARDLEWRFDAILRLAETNVPGKRDRVELADNYVEPRALWWAFDPESARLRGSTARAADNAPDDPMMGGSSKQRPAVVLIDEIDKAEPEVANDLLEPFDVKRFRVAETRALVEQQREVFLVVTTNEERDLPQAFLRRCIVFELEMPNDDVLMKIARAHFKTDLDDPAVLAVLAQVRKLAGEATKANVRAPGIAEFIDALRAVRTLAPPKDEWDAITRLAMWKHPVQRPEAKGG
jgi:MoxR-like ATPase